MPTSAKSLKSGAECRAAIVSGLTAAGQALDLGGIVKTSQVAALKKSYAVIGYHVKTMTKSGLLWPSGSKHHQFYSVSAPVPAPTEGRSVVARPRKPVTAITGSSPTIQVDIDRENGRLRIKVHGELTLDLGMK